MNMDLNIKIISHLNATQQFMLYQEDIVLNVKNYKIAAWESQRIAPGAIFEAVLPMEIEARGQYDLGKGSLHTKVIPVNYNSSSELFDNDGALDIRKSTEVSPSDNTIDIHNKADNTRYVVISKDDKPLFGCAVRPEFKVNFAIHPKLYVALSDFEVHEEFFDAATLPRKAYQIDYEGQSSVIITLYENGSTGKIDISHEFKSF